MINNASLSRTIGLAQNRKISREESITRFTADDFIISGQFLVDGVGELLYDVRFPVSFEDKPLFSFGAELDDNQTIVGGSFPTVSGFVVRYDFKELEMKQNRIYKGATLAVVITGGAAQKSWFHWHFVGKAFINPVDDAPTTSSFL